MQTSMLKEEALHRFFSGFGWAAYDENSVPKTATLPYITYEVSTDNIGSPVFLSASLWDRSTSWRSVTAKALDIARELNYGGVTLPFDNGVLFLTQGSPFSQRVADDDDTIRRIMINIAAEFCSAV